MKNQQQSKKSIFQLPCVSNNLIAQSLIVWQRTLDIHKVTEAQDTVLSSVHTPAIRQQ